MEILRIGIFIEQFLIPSWAYKMLEEIKEINTAEIVLMVKKKEKAIIKSNFLSKILYYRKNLIFLIYEKVDQKIFKCDPDAFKLRDIRDLISTNIIEAETISTKFSDRFNKEDLAEIKKNNIDVFIRLGFKILRGEILKSAKYGIWSFHHGDNKINRGGPAGLWEVFENWDETGVTLQILTEDLDGGTVLYKSYSSTDSISVHRNRNNYYWKSVSIIPRMLRELIYQGGDAFLKKVNTFNLHPQFYENRLYKAPGNWTVFLNISILLIKKIFIKIESLFFIDQWILQYKLSACKSISTSFYQFSKLIPPRDRFWADPYIISRNGKYYIFIEETQFKSAKGHISLIVMDENAKFTKPIKVLERNYHLSYPNIIEENGVYFMIPETSQNNSIELYRCSDFPLKWEFEKTLFKNIKAYDSTVFFHEQKYWLFTNIIRNNGASSNDELYLFFADYLTCMDWTSHPCNPIVSDVKNARSAGRVFIYNNKIYRPSQDCSKHYGYGMKINQIIELSENGYKEVIVDSISPHWDKNIISTHTFAFMDGLTIIDAEYKRRRFASRLKTTIFP